MRTSCRGSALAFRPSKLLRKPTTRAPKKCCGIGAGQHRTQRQIGGSAGRNGWKAVISPSAYDGSNASSSRAANCQAADAIAAVRPRASKPMKPSTMAISAASPTLFAFAISGTRLDSPIPAAANPRKISEPRCPRVAFNTRIGETNSADSDCATGQPANKLARMNVTTTPASSRETRAPSVRSGFPNKASTSVNPSGAPVAMLVNAKEA
jgi:hypothetical protein